MVATFDALYKWSFRGARKAEALAGLWNGTYEQSSGSRAGKYKLVVRLRRKRGSSLLAGRGLAWPVKQGSNPRLNDVDPLDFACTMPVPFIRLDFRNSDENKVQFGTIIAKLSGMKRTAAPPLMPQALGGTIEWLVKNGNLT